MSLGHGWPARRRHASTVPAVRHNNPAAKPPSRPTPATPDLQRCIRGSNRIPPGVCPGLKMAPRASYNCIAHILRISRPKHLNTFQSDPIYRSFHNKTFGMAHRFEHYVVDGIAHGPHPPCTFIRVLSRDSGSTPPVTTTLLLLFKCWWNSSAQCHPVVSANSANCDQFRARATRP